MIKKIWEHLEEIFLLPSLMFTVVLIFIQVVMRYRFNNSLSWSEELARYIFIWQTWIGVSYATKNRTHLRITHFRDRLSEKGKKIIEILVYIIWIGFAFFAAYKGYLLAIQIAGFGQRSPALGLPMEYAYMAIPCGCTLMTIRLIENIVHDYIPKPGKEVYEHE